MNKRYITAAILIATIFPILYFGGIALKVLVAVFTFIATWEINNLVAKNWPKYLSLLMYPILAGVVCCSYLSIQHLMISFAIALILLLMWLVFFESIKFEEIGLWFMLICIIGMMVYGIDLMYKMHPYFIFYMIAGTVATDTGAYFIGRTMGKHKLNERISPNKTIEGSLGGFVFGFLISFVYALIVLKFFWQTKPMFIILSSLLMPIVGQIGDLAFSAIKRHYQVKDFSNIFPGHGGALDRLDSISFNCIVLMVLIILFWI